MDYAVFWRVFSIREKRFRFSNVSPKGGVSVFLSIHVSIHMRVSGKACTDSHLLDASWVSYTAIVGKCWPCYYIVFSIFLHPMKIKIRIEQRIISSESWLYEIFYHVYIILTLNLHETSPCTMHNAPVELELLLQMQITTHLAMRLWFDGWNLRRALHH